MRRLLIGLAAVVALAACGGGVDIGSDGDTGAPDPVATDAPDPCTLADDTILATYFGAAVPEPERGSAGPISSCSWRNANANSLLIQVATDYPLFKPDPCDGCLDLSFGDDGYSSGSVLQSSAAVVDGSLWLSVSTTGFGDDGESVAALLETVFDTATG